MHWSVPGRAAGAPSVAGRAAGAPSLRWLKTWKISKHMEKNAYIIISPPPPTPSGSTTPLTPTFNCKKFKAMGTGTQSNPLTKRRGCLASHDHHQLWTDCSSVGQGHLHSCQMFISNFLHWFHNWEVQRISKLIPFNKFPQSVLRIPDRPYLSFNWI